MNARHIALSVFLACFVVPTVRAEDAKPEKKTAKAADGLTLVYDAAGKGDTALVFLHGWCGDRAYWKHQVPAFAKDYRVIAIEQAGHGESGKDRKAWTVESLAADVEAVVKAEGLKRVILIGHSMGGPVSLLAAKKMPGTVVAVVGADTLQNAEYHFPEDQQKQIFAAMEADFKGTLGMFMPAMVAEKTDPELKKWIADRAAAQDKTMAVGLMKDMSRLDQKGLLKEAKVPVRAINSGGGYTFFQPTMVDINKKYADFDAVTIPDVGHYPMLEKPAEFNEKLKGVLKELAAKK
ncbi:MAG TPA: alpha/beta hydrolase [Gemmataceae bacterium]|nr:alpha/beta hydrolase [Gemmataceae bacterium]